MRPALIDLPEPGWIGLCRAEVDRGKSISQVSRETGIARSSLSMLLAGTYPADSLDLVTRKHGARIVQLYRDEVLCPHLHRSISPTECRALAGMPMSTSLAEDLRQRRACRGCPLNPLKPKET